jgi:hypothetical protein
MAVLLLTLLAGAAAQNPSQPGEGIDSGNYNIRQSVEFGYRNANISGNVANYNTFVNLNTGVRLFEQSLDVRSLNHAGLVFDNLSTSSFGYGGDPIDVTRLRVSKNRWYDFSGSFRRDRYPWNYNLSANPLNPATSVPAVPIANSLHAMNVVRRMTDLTLILLPQSRIKFRLNYLRNIQEGPSFSSFGGATILDPPTGYGTQTQLFQNWKTTLNGYRIGVDFQALRKTSIHYDQFLEYFKQDTSYLDKNFNFQLSNGTPADLGVVFDTASAVNVVPCPTPILNPTKPPTADPSCNGHLSYSRFATPRGTLPTESFSFQSDSIKNVSMAGRAAYSSRKQDSNNLNELFTGSNVSTLQVATRATGSTHAKQIITNSDLAVTWSVTPKFRVVDSFTYDRFQLPGFWGFTTLSQYAQAPLINGGPSLLLPPATFNSANCSPPFTADTCPQHSADSGPDISTGTWFRYLGQNYKANTLQFEYDFTSKVGARLGFLYGNRKVFSQDNEFVANEVFFPGGVGPARGDCVDPTVCTPQPDGSLTFSPGSLGNLTHVQDADINSYSMQSGIWARPTNAIRLNFDWDFFWADSAFVRSDPRKRQTYKFQASFAPSRWLSLDASFSILEHQNLMQFVNGREHDRSVTISAVLAPNEHFSFDLGYVYNDIFASVIECWAYGSGVAPPVAPGLLPAGTITTPCSVPSDLQGADVTAFGGQAFYGSTTHFAYGDLRWKLVPRLTLRLGYAGTFADGSTLFLNPNAPVGPLQYVYQKPYAGFMVDLAKGLAFKTTWNFYGYTRSTANPPGLAPIGSQDFTANNLTLAFRYVF